MVFSLLKVLLIFHFPSLTQFLRVGSLRRFFNKYKAYRENNTFLFKNHMKIGQSTLPAWDIDIKHMESAAVTK